MASKWWPDVGGLAPPDQFFTAGADDDGVDDDADDFDTGGNDDNDGTVSEASEASEMSELSEAEGVIGEDDEASVAGGGDDDFDNDFDYDLENGKGRGGKGRKAHPRMVYVFGSVSGLQNTSNASISTKKLPRLVVTSTSFKGAAKKLMTALGRHILGLKKGAVLRSKRNQTIKFGKLQLFRVRKVGAERLARLLGAPSSSNTALMARLAQVDPAKMSPKAFVRLNHKYNGIVTFLSEDNAHSSKIRQKNTTIRVQVKIKSDAARHKNMNFLRKK